MTGQLTTPKWYNDNVLTFFYKEILYVKTQVSTDLCVWEGLLQILTFRKSTYRVLQ